MKGLTLTPTDSMTEDIPDFSILMTVSARNCYFLQRAIESIRVQFWANLQLVCVCDHVSLVDEINETLVENQMKGDVIYVEPSLNRSQKFLEAVKLATGRWCVILDCDDMMPTGALIKLDTCLKMFPDADYFTSAQAQIDTKNVLIKLLSVDPSENTLQGIRHKFRQKHLWGFKNSEIGALSDALNSPYIVEDYHFFATLAMRGKMPLCIPFPLCCYRRHSLQITQRESAQITEMCKRIHIKIDNWVKNSDPLLTLRSESLVPEMKKKMGIMRAAVANLDNPF